ncbi:L domain-like protein [Trametopsis cervina]|nr:L domain-like protein [Trametopsis cervina]
MSHTPSSSTSYSREVSSKFKEHLSIYVPPYDFPVETSRFSPESPEPPPLPPAPPRTMSTWTNTATMRSTTPVRREFETPPTPKSAGASTSTGSKSRIAKLIFDIRALAKGSSEPDIVPIQPANLPPWPPLSIEKRTCCHDCPCHSLQKDKKKQKKKWRNRVLIYALIVLLLYLLGNTVALNVKVYGSSPSGGVSNNGTVSGFSADAQQCVSQYTVNAPSDPLGYPCSSCLPVLQGVSPSALQSNPQNGQILDNAVQFCGLRSIFETAGTDGQSALKGGNWAQDVKFCAWSGVSCDGSGKVSSLSLTFPGISSSLPDELGALTGLQSLSIIGNGQSPAGSLPSSFSSWSSLANLHLESTALSSLPSDFLSTLNKVTTLTLIKNSQMGNSLPSSITSSSLQNLIVNGQTLANPLPSLTTSRSLGTSLKLLDLSSTSISGTITGTISSLGSLVELHLDSNNLSAPLPDSFPSGLQILTISNNTQLSGPVSGSFCNLGSLQTCNVQGTGLTAPATGCSLCQFSQTSTSS